MDCDANTGTVSVASTAVANADDASTNTDDEVTPPKKPKKPQLSDFESTKLDDWVCKDDVSIVEGQEVTKKVAVTLMGYDISLIKVADL